VRSLDTDGFAHVGVLCDSFVFGSQGDTMLLFYCLVMTIIPALVYPAICWAYWRIVNHKRSVIATLLASVETKDLYIRAYAPVSHTQRDPFASLFDVTYNKASYMLAVAMNMAFAFLAAAIGLVRLGHSFGLSLGPEIALGRSLRWHEPLAIFSVAGKGCP